MATNVIPKSLGTECTDSKSKLHPYSNKMVLRIVSGLLELIDILKQTLSFLATVLIEHCTI